MKPTNRIEINGNEIKVNDINTPIKITVLDVDGNHINLRNNINYFRLTKDDEHYVEVTDITFNNDDIIFKLPPMKKGLYSLEIKDNNGSIYPAGDDIKLLLRQSFEGLKETTYKSMSDHILEEIEPIILYHIEHNPEKFRGQDGVDGYTPVKGVDYFDGEDGKDGRDGVDGVDGKDGKDGVDGYTPIKDVDYFDGVDGVDGKDGKDGVDGYTPIKDVDYFDGVDGVDGYTPVKGVDYFDGEDGGFNGEIIGVNNLFNMSDAYGLNNVGDIDYDVVSGVLTYTGIIWNFRLPLRLNNTIHTIYFKDYESNPNYSSGYIRVEVSDLHNNNIIPQKNVLKDTPLKLDLTSMSTPQDVLLIIRTTGSESYSGSILQPMLVEGEYTSGWQPSLKDTGIGVLPDYLHAWVQGDITGTVSNSNKLTLTKVNGGLSTLNNEVVLSSGLWFLSCDVRLDSLYYDNVANISINKNDVTIISLNMATSMVKTMSRSHIFMADDNDIITLYAGKNGEGDLSMGATVHNGIRLFKISG